MYRILIFAIVLLSCNRHTNPPVTVKGNTILLGKIRAEQLEQPPFADWYKKEYAVYNPDPVIKDSLASMVQSYRFEIFLGTWCGDSKREVPRLIKVLNDLHVKPSAITIITVGNSDTLYKQSPTHEERGKSIYRVPHLNVYRQGKEVGRITETPVKSWEKDLLAIVSGQSYTPTHATLQQVGRVIEDALQQNAAVRPEDMLASMRALPLTSAQTLNSYGYVKLYSNEAAPAYLAFKLNTLLFPDAWYTYNAMAGYYRMQQDAVQEKYWLELVLQKKPDEENAKKRLKML